MTYYAKFLFAQGSVICIQNYTFLQIKKVCILIFVMLGWGWGWLCVKLILIYKSILFSKLLLFVLPTRKIQNYSFINQCLKFIFSNHFCWYLYVIRQFAQGLALLLAQLLALLIAQAIIVNYVAVKDTTDIVFRPAFGCA